MKKFETSLRSGAWRVVLFLAICVALAPPADARQDPAPVRQTVEDFLRVQVRGLPGEASFTVGRIDANNNLQSCEAMQAFLPAGARSFGRVHVGVRCLDEPRWQLYVPAQVRLVSDYLVATRALVMGEPIADGDVTTRRGDLGELPAGVLTREELAIGQSPRVAIGAGQPLRADLLRRESVVQAGQQVKVVSRGAGFSVSTEGQAMNSAAEGQLARVRTAAGQTISGVARSGGLVEINF